jgi:KDO2-lipid IV(A) lauroyltransferase
MTPRFLLPQYWPMWVALGLLRLLARWSYPALLAFGGALGAFAGRLPLPQVRVARRNIAMCLPGLSAAERERVLRANFRSTGITLGETALAWFAPKEQLAALARIEGLERLDELTAAGRGVILLAAHFTTLELGARFATVARFVHAVYKPSKNALLTEFFRRYRGAVSAGMIASDDIREMIRVLRGGGVVWYAPDQAFRGKGATMVPLFGVPAPTNVATSRLARMTGAAVLPYFVERLPGAEGYVVRIGPPLDDFPTDDARADTLRFHRLIEQEVARIPEQYLWVHKRFKPIAPTDPDHYA